MRYIPKSESFDRRGQGEKLYCIIAGSAVMVTGRYFDGLKEIRSSDESYDEQKAVELWETSVGLTL
ncbi:hypothetical protein [Nostoc sp. PCC 9305]|uniref:hypothetical protein n=1 Tax=Nostoc sp. PCC 9305 TaxID=296636 RepID=UPI0039C6AF83